MWTKSHSSVSIWKWRTNEASLFSLHRTKIKGHDIGHKTETVVCITRHSRSTHHTRRAVSFAASPCQSGGDSGGNNTVDGGRDGA